MALYRGITRQDGSRSNTYLIKSGHAAPAADWVLSNQFLDNQLAEMYPGGVLFNYQYGGVGMEEVTIAKGRFVGVGKSQKNFQDQIFKTPITLPGMSLGNNVVGMVPYNICKDWLEEDYFGGNKPAVVTTEYVVLPYMPKVAPATTYDIAGVLDEERRISKELKMPWGALIGEAQEGDFIKSTPSGRATKWVKGTDDPTTICGKILEMDLNQESWGWEKWMLWDPSVRTEEDNQMNRPINRSGNSSLPSDGGYPYDPQYVEGYLDLMNSYQSHINYNPTGIPGLHDGSGNYPGFGRNDNEFVDVEIGAIPAGVADNSIVVLQVKDYAGNNAKNLVEGSVTVKLDTAAVPAENVTIDYVNGTINIKAMAADANKKVKATFKLRFYGTPSYLDFKGVIGSASILLSL